MFDNQTWDISYFSVDGKFHSPLDTHLDGLLISEFIQIYFHTTSFMLILFVVQLCILSFHLKIILRETSENQYEILIY